MAYTATQQGIVNKYTSKFDDFDEVESITADYWAHGMIEGKRREGKYPTCNTSGTKRIFLMSRGQLFSSLGAIGVFMHPSSRTIRLVKKLISMRKNQILSRKQQLEAEIEDMYFWNTHRQSLHDCDAITKTALIQLSDGRVLTRSEGWNAFDASEDEIKEYVQAFHFPASCRSTGLTYEGEFYSVSHSNPISFLCKKGDEGLLVVKAYKVLIVAVIKGDKEEWTEAGETVEGLKEELKAIDN